MKLIAKKVLMFSRSAVIMFIILGINSCTNDNNTVAVIKDGKHTSATEKNSIISEGVIPSPFTDNTTLRFLVNKSQRVRISIFSIDWQELKVYSDGVLADGEHSMNLSTTDLAPGAYYMVVKGEEETLVISVVCAR